MNDPVAVCVLCLNHHAIAQERLRQIGVVEWEPPADNFIERQVGDACVRRPTSSGFSPRAASRRRTHGKPCTRWLDGQELRAGAGWPEERAMTDAEYIAIELADAYGLDPVRFMDASAFLSSVGKALKAMTPDEIVRGVLDQGGLEGLRKPYGGIFKRIEKLAEDQAWRIRLTDERGRTSPWAMVDRAVRRGDAGRPRQERAALLRRGRGDARR